MGTEDFWTQLPTGKEDKPLLFAMGPLEYDFHDIDGLYYMLDKKLSGCLTMMWAKPMNPEIMGKVTLDGRPVENVVNQFMEAMGNMWILGIPLRGLVTEYGKEYQLHVEGFVDADGNEMNPQDFTVKGIEKTEPEPEHAEHEQIALEAAREGIVLLKNEGNVLPLCVGETCNLFGRGVHEFRIGAVGAGKINPRYSVNFIEAIRAQSEYFLNEELVEFYGCDRDLIPPEGMLARAKEKSDTAIIFVTRAAGENQDASTSKGEFYLSDEEDALLKKVSGYFAKTIVILNVGYPIDVSFVEKYKIAGLVYLGFAGMLAGQALLDILSGKVNPSGKLPDTWAYDYFDIPASRNFYDCADKPLLAADDEVYLDTCYEEGLYVGYRYFTTFKKQAAYPFGFGLSYTEFELVSGEVNYDGESCSLEVTVKNIGDVPGKEVVQVYIGKPETELEQPERELVFFEKTKELAPGEEQSIQIAVPAAHFSSYSEEKAAYILSKGNYGVYVGNSVNAGEAGSFVVVESKVLKQVENLMVCKEEFMVLSKKEEESTFPKGEKSGVADGKTTFLPYQKRKSYPAEFMPQVPERKLSFADVKEAVKGNISCAGQGMNGQEMQYQEDGIAQFVSQMSPEELARLNVCASAGWGMEGIGEAGRVFKVEGYGLPDFPVSDGNSGVNLNIKNIGMPSSVTICATFNKELSAEVGRVIGEEAKTLGIPLILAPAFNIHRNPLNGRQPEYFSEDPYLAGVMAGFYAKGMEGAGVASCYKHLIANNCESSRKRNQSLIKERTLREIYFRTFEYAMEIQMPASFMTAYNAVNGCPTAADEELIQGLLRKENGFDGFVMTDWTTYDTVNVAAMAQVGNCFITPGSTDDTYTGQIIKGLEDGTVELARLQENVASLVRVMARFAD